NWKQSDESKSESSRSVSASVPARPPKPVTASEVRHAIESPDQVTAQVTKERPISPNTNLASQTHASSAATRRAASEESESRTAENAEDSIFVRLEGMRRQVFDRPADISSQKRQIGTESTAAAPSPETVIGPSVSASPASVQSNQVSAANSTQQERRPPPQNQMERSDSIISEADQQNNRVREKRIIDEEIPVQVARRNTGTQVDVSESASVRRESISALASSSSPNNNQTKLRSNSPVSGIDVPKRIVDASTSSENFNQNRANNGQKGGMSAIPQTNSVEVVTTSEAVSHSLTNNADGSKDDEYQIANRRILHSESNSERNSVHSGDIGTSNGNASETVANEKIVLVCPRLELETSGPPKVVVGQEVLYQIRAINRGASIAEQIVFSIDIPAWIDILQPDTSGGTTSIIPKEGADGVREFIWKISRLDGNAEEKLVLHLVPKERKTVDLRIKYDFFKPSSIAKMVVQEPVFEMALEGPDEVLWGTKVGYKLLLRNVGNGDAENVKLELLQTGSDMKSCELAVLKAGEEQVIDVDVWTGKQEYIDIHIQASGQNDLSAQVLKRVIVNRPNLVMSIESPEVQFVGSHAEYILKVRNTGTAAANDVEMVALIPLGAKYVTCSGGGSLMQQNQLQWKIESIPVGDVFIASLVCEPRREGTCKLETTLSDRSGILAQCSGTMQAEAIVELKLDVETPKGPVEVGAESVYLVHLQNRGTKTAENVEVTAAFGIGLEPFHVEGGNAYMNDGQVVFDSIPTINAGDTIILKVKTKAEQPGNHRIRTDVVCSAIKVHLVNEQTTYYYQRQKGRTAVASSETTLEQSGESEPQTFTANPSEPQMK
ncbi:MAG: hypothetical protein ACRCUY_04860, partial [Thermoguttaceae bacterium]